jgi:hypothetical protein
VQWGYPEPDQNYYERVGRRLPAGLRTLLAAGVEDGANIPAGPKFTVRGLPPGKGPYAWFSRRTAPHSSRRDTPSRRMRRALSAGSSSQIAALSSAKLKNCR